MSTENCTTKTCSKCKRELPATVEYFRKQAKCRGGLHTHCLNCEREQGRKAKALWFENHQEESNLRSKKFHKKNPEYGKEYSAKNRQRINENMREWRKRNPERWKELAQISKAKRDYAKRNLPNNFTDEDWDKCKTWFNNQCAFCGNVAPLTLDHYIPYYNLLCPGNVPHNIIPLCKSCNSSKNKRVASDWLLKTFGKAKAIAIMQLIEKYFQSLKDG